MPSNAVVFQVLLLLSASSVGLAQGPPVPPFAGKVPAAATLSAEVVAFEASVLRGAQPTVRTWILNQGNAAYRSQSDLALIDRSLRPSIVSRFAGQSIGEADVEALILLVLTQALRDQEADLQSLLEGLRRNLEEKEKLRELLDRLQALVDGTILGKDPEPCTAPLCMNLRLTLAALAAWQAKAGIAQPVVPRDARTLGELRGAVVYLRDKLDSIGGAVEAQQLRLQQLIERRTRANQETSRLLKKVAAVQTSVIQNLK